MFYFFIGIKPFDFKGERIESWLFRFENEVKNANISLDNAVTLAPYFFKGNLVTWAYLREPSDWNQFRNDLIKKSNELLVSCLTSTIDGYQSDGIDNCTKLMKALSLDAKECAIQGDTLDLYNFLVIKLKAIREIFTSLNNQQSKLLAVSLIDKTDMEVLVKHCGLEDKEFFSLLEAHSKKSKG